MHALDVVKQVANDTGTSLYRISLDMGKTNNYMSSVMQNGSTPKADTLARMLDVCGYGLYTMPKDKAPKDAIQITADSERSIARTTRK